MNCLRLVGMTGFHRAGPPACKLQLRQDSQNQDLFFFEPMDTISGAAPASPGVSSSFFLDPEGRQTDELQNWLCLAKELYRAGKPILPLFINGPVKVGYNGLTKGWRASCAACITHMQHGLEGEG